MVTPNLKPVMKSQLAFDYFNGRMVEMLNEQMLWREVDDVRLQIINDDETWHVVAEVFVYAENHQEGETIQVGSTSEFTYDKENNPFTNIKVELAISDLISLVARVLKTRKVFQDSYRSVN